MAAGQQHYVHTVYGFDQLNASAVSQSASLAPKTLPYLTFEAGSLTATQHRDHNSLAQCALHPGPPDCLRHAACRGVRLPYQLYGVEMSGEMLTAMLLNKH